MKKINQQSANKNRVFYSLVLASLILLGTNLPIVNSAIAYPENSFKFAHETINNRSTLISQIQSNHSNNSLPAPIANRVKKDLANRTGIAPGKLKITNYSQETWPNGCLGISEPEQICTQALVPGWKITVTDGQKTWVYRTDSSGRNVRMEQ